MKIQLAGQIFHEDKMYVAYSPELDVSSCATTQTKAQKNLIEAVWLFLEEAEKKGSLSQICKKQDLSAALVVALPPDVRMVYDLPQCAPMLFMGLCPCTRSGRTKVYGFPLLAPRAVR